MSDLKAALAALSGEARQELAHQLLLALEGRDAPASRTVETVPEDVRGTSSGRAGEIERNTEDLSSPAQAKPQSARTRWAEAHRGGVQTRPYEERPTSVGSTAHGKEATPSRSHITAVYGPGGKTVTLRRDVEASAAQTPETAAQAAAAAPLDTHRQLRDISEYFRQDSRRYDPGFTRY